MQKGIEVGSTEGAARSAKRKPAAAECDAGLSHNLNGQKLGRKGRDTRDRILAAAAEVVAESETPVSLSAVARKASLGMTSLYLYFKDLSELLQAVLEPIMATAEDAYLGHLRQHWPDETLNADCYEFVRAYFDFWEKHSRILHLRNAMSDQRDKRMMLQRVGATQPIIRLLIDQMECAGAETGTPSASMATVLMTGIERVVTVATDNEMRRAMDAPFRPNVANFLRAEARLLEVGIMDYRLVARGIQA